MSTPSNLPAHAIAARPARLPVAGRSCGSCTLCCKTVAVAELAKPAGEWCRHCRRSAGCAIYDTRPAGCRDFDCEWLLTADLGVEWKPERARFVLIVTTAGHLTACVDPGFPLAWRAAPYHATLTRWAREQAADPSAAWPGVDVWIGQRCIVILPDGEKDLGVVAPDEAIRVERSTTAFGPVWVAEKFKVTPAVS